MRLFKINKTKILPTLVIIETILLFILISICYNFYFHYTSTKNLINETINYFKYIYFIIKDLTAVIITIGNNGITELTEVFNNRELAIGFLLVIFIFYAFSVKSVRGAIPNLLKTMFNRKLIYWYITMIIYFLFMIVILQYIGFWEYRLLKDSIIWFFVIGIISTSRATGKAKDFQYFFTIIKDNIKIIVLIEFISNMYSFPFLGEVVLVVIATFLSILVAMIEHSPGLQDKNGILLKKFFNLILIFIGILLIYHSVKLMILNLGELVVIDLLKDIALPPFLSFMFVFYIYLFAVAVSYEVLFVRLKFLKTIDEKLRFKLKYKILLFCNIHISRISNFVQWSKLMQGYVKNSDDIEKLFINYRSYNNKLNKD